MILEVCFRTFTNYFPVEQGPNCCYHPIIIQRHCQVYFKSSQLFYYQIVGSENYGVSLEHSDTLARCDILIRCDTLAQSDTLTF